jgi:predicted O-linked N-acetylglucosamine transferase (SPINDLY family)
MDPHHHLPNDALTIINPGWQPVAWQYLLSDDYGAVAKFYESLLEKEPNVIEHYWYLGLAYLLLGQEEQAQLTWFVVLGQYDESELDEKIDALTKILDTEGDRQDVNQNYQISWLIRGHIRELNPDDYSNLLQFICLDVIVSPSAIEQLSSWHLEDLVLSIPFGTLKDETFIRTLSLISGIPTVDSLYFIRYCLENGHDTEQLIQTIIGSIQPLINRRDYPKYIIEVIEILLEFQENNLSFINIIYIYNFEFKDYDTVVDSAKMLLAKSNSITEKLFSSTRLLYSTLMLSNWDEGLLIAEQYLHDLDDFLGCKPDLKYNFIYEAFMVINQPLLYLQDKPVKNRQLINYISRSFQDSFYATRESKVLSFPNKATLKRPLKIGYIGHVFRSHSVGYLSRWLILHGDRKNIINYGYTFSDNSDEITENYFVKYMASYHVFLRNVEGMVKQIQADEIDILVDLDSFTYDLTCQVMALKPAPIQVTWLGFDASGIPNVDYFIADPYVLPNDADQYYSEKIWRLPHTYLGIDGFEVGIPTLKREDLDIPPDAVIFANYQNALKRHPHILELQMKILKAVPNSYLLIKGTGKAIAIQQLFETIAQKIGVSLDRLRFLEPCETEIQHRANLGIVDIFLDTYPYNGATTTLEVLWSETPLVTRVGEQFAARNSYTFMINAGITEGIAWTDEEYVEWGIKLGTNENLRKEISWKLRQSKKTSPLWNGKQFARDMEDAYRQMWEIYVKENT